jgi:predicted phage baseplate assembly protein
MVLADHGRTVQETMPQSEPVPGDEPFRLRLRLAPLTFQCQPDEVDYDSITGALATRRIDLECPAREAKPAVSLRAEFPTGPEVWRAVPDLLDSPPLEPHLVVDVDHQGRAELRFGDGEYGREPAGATSFTTTYRVGNGRAGNVGAEALAHLVQPFAANWPLAVIGVRNPLAAQDGTDAETIQEVRQLAPAAFRAEQFRAVTEGDYVAAARKLPEVAEAVATFRWTGSWYTVFVGIDPRNPADLITEPGGRTRLVPALERRVRAFLTRYRLAGYDMEILSGQYVPLDIELTLCVALAYFRGDVVEAVRRALSNRVNGDGSLGFFHPDRFTFGQAVYLSQLYAAVEAVEGVDSLVVTRFQRYGKVENGELQAGLLPIGAWEIARLDNDPNFMENGVLRIHADGGK